MQNPKTRKIWFRLADSFTPERQNWIGRMDSEEVRLAPDMKGGYDIQADCDNVRRVIGKMPRYLADDLRPVLHNKALAGYCVSRIGRMEYYSNMDEKRHETPRHVLIQITVPDYVASASSDSWLTEEIDNG